MALTAKKVYAILKRQISDMEAKLNSPVRYRGTVATADLLPLNPDIGDMYNIESKSIYGEAGMNVAWNGVVWDTMGAPIDMSLYLTKEEAEAVIQRLVTEYFEKNPVKPGATTEQAQQIEQNKTDIASLKTETASLKEDLSTKITKFYASSQGETHLADSDNGKIQDMMLFGKSEQAVTTGAQLLGSDTVFIRNTDDISIPINNPYAVSWTHNTNVPIRGVYLDNAKPILANKQYTISFDARFSDGNSHDMRCVDTDKICVNGKNSILIKIHEKNSTVSFYTRGNITEGLSVTISNIMLEEGSTAHDFEPYTGGQPSPSPNYPQEIKSVVNPIVKLSNEDGTQFKTVTLPYTLNAIPVSSGGNVVIDGQQYIADYIDVENGKIVKYVKKLFLKPFQWSKAINKGVLRFYASTIDAVGIDGNKVIKNVFSISSHFTFVTGTPDRIGTFAANADGTNANIGFAFSTDTTTSSDDFNNWILNNKPFVLLPVLKEELPLTSEQILVLKKLSTYYPTTNISVNSEQLDGYTVFNYPISMENGWNYVKQQIGDTREYIYDMDARTQDTDLQAAEAYVNSEYAVALTELEV